MNTPATVLLIENGHTNPHILDTLLKKAGYKVVKCVSATLALEYLQHIQIGLIMLDVALPEMDGISFVKHLRTNPAYAWIPIILVTSNGSNQDYIKALKEGANALLTRSCSFQELISTIKQALVVRYLTLLQSQSQDWRRANPT